MAAYAAVVSLINNIEQMMNHPHLSKCFDNQQIQSILHKAGFLVDFIESYNHGGSVTEEAEALERMITTAAHLVEYVMESHVVDHIHAGSAGDGEAQHDLHSTAWSKLADWLRQIASAARTANSDYAGTVPSIDLQLWEMIIISTAELVEDMVESQVVDRVHGGSSDDEEPHHDQLLQRESTDVWNKLLDWWRRRIASSSAQNYGVTVRSLDLQPLIQYMDFVAETVMEVREKDGVLQEEEEKPPTHPTRPLMESRSETAMVGLDDELAQLLDSLTSHHSNRQVISIVGMGGMGKTTLAQNLYTNPLVKEHFDIRAWATISQQYSLEEILSQLVSCLEGSSRIEGDLGERVHKTLCGRRYLIVLDDIWGVEPWDKVRSYFPDYGNRSRFLLTTRLSNLASDCGSMCFTMNLLDEEKSRKLFREKTFFPHKDDPLQLEDVARQIVRQCKGLALSIVVIRGLLLNSPRNVEYWKNVLKGLEKSDSKEKQQGLDALYLSYNHLPPYLKPCFLYMGVFDEDSRIRVSRITRLWVAEGFIRPKGTRVLEEIAEDYLKDLSDRNLVIVVERRHTRKIKSVSIHDLLRDLCVKVAEQQQFFHVRKSGEEIHGTERRLVCDPKKREFGNALGRSLLGRNRFPEYDECKLLRVLEATEGNFGYSNEQVYGKVNLRYFVHQLPTLYPNICLLWNLQTLSVPFYSPLVMAPPGIWKMRQLRHFKCLKLYHPPPPPRIQNGYMENLQTLKMPANLRLREEVCEIIPNIKKLGLLYHGEMMGYDDSLIDCLP